MGVIVLLSGGTLGRPNYAEEKMERISKPCEVGESMVRAITNCFVFFCFEGKTNAFFLMPPHEDNWCRDPPIGEELPCKINGKEVKSGTILNRFQKGPSGCGLKVCMNSKVLFYAEECVE